MLLHFTAKSEEAVKNSSPYIIIYFTGHGIKGDGNWAAVDKCYISLSLVMFSIVKGGFKGRVLINCDNCYAGHWAEECNKLWNEKGNEKESPFN